MRVFVSGGSGFIGTNLIESFLQDDWEVLNFDLVPPRNSQHSVLFQEGDIRNGEALTAVVRDFRKRPVVLSITHNYHGFHRQSEMRE